MLMLKFHHDLSLFGDSYKRFAGVTDLQQSTCIHKRRIWLQKWHPVIDWQRRLTLWVFVAKIQEIKDVGDPGRSYRIMLTKTHKKIMVHNVLLKTWTLTWTQTLIGGRTNVQFVRLIVGWTCFRWNLPALGYVAMRISSFLAWKFWMFSQLLVKSKDIETPLKSKSSGREHDSIWERVARKVSKRLEIIKLQLVRYAQEKSSVANEIWLFQNNTINFAENLYTNTDFQRYVAMLTLTSLSTIHFLRLMKSCDLAWK